jgi:hypothetical protein
MFARINDDASKNALLLAVSATNQGKTPGEGPGANGFSQGKVSRRTTVFIVDD